MGTNTLDGKMPNKKVIKYRKKYRFYINQRKKVKTSPSLKDLETIKPFNNRKIRQ